VLESPPTVVLALLLPEVGVLAALLATLVGVESVMEEGVVVLLVLFPLPVNPPLAPEALIRASASSFVSQAILVPGELTRGRAKHERPLVH